MRTGIIGASGYTGAELLRVCAGHPELQVVVATGETQAGTAVGSLYPSLHQAFPDLRFSPLDPAALGDLGLDVVFLALPHGQAQKVAPELIGRVGRIVDLSADFRLKRKELYDEWYGASHACPDLLDRFAFGIPELHRTQLAGAELVSVAGCYVTAASLALAPLVSRGVVEPTGVVVDAASGVSGSGRTLRHDNHFATANEDFVAYGLLNHRHTPEIEQVTGAQVLFTPHLAPMTRGILATCYARPTGPTSTPELLEVMRTAYAGEQFVSVIDEPPSTKATLGSNSAHLTARYDERTGWVVALAAIDNLVKGASGQAVQCANLALGLTEGAGLSSVGVYP
ncbi:MAG TPA: N-acetyl-gamma-glutamyl-phosphate reductase [Acidimicrobiales bacterium]|nr:N-acetyl-gamma-glutamyl-phosphate reductase [Acidimicrobiales bacterium]